MYCERRQLNLVYGKLNIDRWADLDNSQDSGEIEERVNYAITQAEAYINGRLGSSPYTFPITLEAVPTIISHITAIKAGLILYDGRRVVADETESQVSAQQQEFEDYINRILSDTLKLPLIRLSTKPPKVVTAPEEFEERRYGFEVC